MINLRDLIANPPAILTSDEAAAYLRVTPGHLANLRYKRQGPAFIAGRPARYRKSDLDAWIAGMVVTTTA